MYMLERTAQGIQDLWVEHHNTLLSLSMTCVASTVIFM